jgi:hypothetical protein
MVDQNLIGILNKNTLLGGAGGGGGGINNVAHCTIF